MPERLVLGLDRPERRLQTVSVVMACVYSSGYGRIARCENGAGGRATRAWSITARASSATVPSEVASSGLISTSSISG